MDDETLAGHVRRVILAGPRKGTPMRHVVTVVAAEHTLPEARVRQACLAMVKAGDCYWRNPRHPNRLLPTRHGQPSPDLRGEDAALW